MTQAAVGIDSFLRCRPGDEADKGLERLQHGAHTHGSVRLNGHQNIVKRVAEDKRESKHGAEEQTDWNILIMMKRKKRSWDDYISRNDKKLDIQSYLIATWKLQKSELIASQVDTVD